MKWPAMVLLAVVIAVSAWTADALLDALVFDPGPFGSRWMARGAWHHVYSRGMFALAVSALGVFAVAMWSLRRRAQAEFSFLANLLDQIGDAVAATDLAGRITYVNAAAARRAGRPKEALVGRPADALEEVFCLGAEREDIVAKTLAEGAWRGEVSSCTGAGRSSVFECRTWVVRDERGRGVGVCGVSTDITDRKRHEEVLQRERDRVQLYLDIAGVMFLLLDREGRVALVNRKGCEILGRPESDIVGKDWFRHFLPERNRVRVRQIFDCLLAGEIESTEYAEGPVVTARGEERIILWHNTVLRDESGRITATLSSGTDITEQKRAQEEHERLQAQIQHTQKLESLGILAGGIAHDFNNLLMGVLGNAGLALMELPPESPARPTIEQVEKAALRAAELTKQMLAYSGRGQFVIEPIHLSNLVDEMAHLLQAVISKKAVLRYDFEPHVPPIEADPTQIRQVVMNLITNASDAIGDRSGFITVRTGLMEADRSYLAATYLDEDLPPGPYAYIEVSDTGCGMTPETQSKMFDPFFTTKRPGRGLGLAAVLGIVRGHRGAIHVRSEPGRGTTFRVLFPCTEERPGVAELDIPFAGTYRGRGSVLVADDEDTVRSVARRILEAAGFEVLTAATGAEAVGLVREHGDRLVLALLDLTMPEMSGDEALVQIRRVRPDLPAILSSGYNEREAAGRVAGDRLAGFIQKPYRPRDLIRKVREILGA